MATHTFKQGKISEYRSESPCLPAGDLPDPGIEAASLVSPALAGGFFTTSATWYHCIVERSCGK